MRRAPCGPRRAALAVLAAALVLGLVPGCTRSWVIERPATPGALPAQVDSLVVRPFIPGQQVQMNPADQALFQNLLRKALDAKARLRTFDAPPTRLPNTVLVDGTWQRFQVDERPGEGLFLRSIDMAVEMTVRHVDAPKPLATVYRRYTYQHVYPGSEAVAALPLDLGNAFAELSAALAEALVPDEESPAIVLHSAREPATGESLALPDLIKGNRYAVVRMYAQAEQLWQLVLFDPTRGENAQRTYHISTRTLSELRNRGMAPEMVAKLEPMTEDSPTNLMPFRRRLRGALGGTTKQEGLILTLSDYETDRTHLNVAAAHANLAAVYALDKRYDLASWHLALAYAHNASQALLDQWSALQQKRKLLPSVPDARAMIALYQRIPPPGAADVTPGTFERSVLPPPAFAAGSAPADSGAGASSGAQGPGAPVALPPPVALPAAPSGSGDSAANPLTPVAPTQVEASGTAPAAPR